MHILKDNVKCAAQFYYKTLFIHLRKEKHYQSRYLQLNADTYDRSKTIIDM